MAETNKTLAIIPARGGSKGIINKNLQVVNNQPLIAWGIQIAKEAGSVDNVIVSTDDSTIVSIAEKMDVDTVIRPSEFCQDNSPSEEALLHALEYFEERKQIEIDWVIFLQCTAPLTLPEDVDLLMDNILSNEADCGLLTAPFHGFVWQKGADGFWEGLNHDIKVRPMRQELKTQFMEAGAVTIMRASRFKKEKHRFFGKIVTQPIPEERLLDINTPTDLKLANIVLKERL